MIHLLIKLGACQEAKLWAVGKTWPEIYETCHRGDWLLWLFQRTNPKDIRQLTLAKAHCANTVRHLMKDERSLKAVDTAIAFGENECTLEELKDAALAADAVAFTAASAADASAAYAASAAVAAADAAAFTVAVAFTVALTAADAAASAADAADAAANAIDHSAAKVENQKLTADICRKYLPIEIWNI